MDESKVEPTGIVRIPERTEKRASVGLRQIQELLGWHYIAMEEPAEVCLQGEDADVGSGAGVGMLREVIYLAPEDISLDGKLLRLREEIRVG